MARGPDRLLSLAAETFRLPPTARRLLRALAEGGEATVMDLAWRLRASERAVRGAIASPGLRPLLVRSEVATDAGRRAFVYRLAEVRALATAVASELERKLGEARALGGSP